MDDKLRYPIGKFEWIDQPNSYQIEKAIETIADFPKKLKIKLEGLNSNDLKKQYRPESWNIAQIVHHIADSHMHCYLRMKHAVLEDTPNVKDYNQEEWAELNDASNLVISYSLNLIEALHNRWSFFLKELDDQVLKRCYFHKERNKKYPIGTTILLYAWHCHHHLSQIENSLNNTYYNKKTK